MNSILEKYIETLSPISAELNRLFPSDAPLVIFDIGCCEGEDSIKYSRSFPNSKIYAFEPLARNFDKSQKNISFYKINNVEVFPVALSNQDGAALFHVSSGRPDNIPVDKWDYGNKSSSLLPSHMNRIYYPWLKFNETVEVKTITLQTFCREQGIHEIDYIHMDVQGAELKVLEGAGQLLESIKSIWLEVETVELYAGQPLIKDVEKWLRKHNFCCWKEKVDGISGDQFYVNRRYFGGPPFLSRCALWRDKVYRKARECCLWIKV